MGCGHSMFLAKLVCVHLLLLLLLLLFGEGEGEMEGVDGTNPRLKDKKKKWWYHPT